jgi:PAS domain-containing protein
MDSSDGSTARLDPALADAAARPHRTAFAFALRFLLVLAGYYLAARLGLLIPYVGTHISLVWLPTGIAVAAFRRWGAGMAPAVYVAAVAANASIGGPLWIAALVGVGNTAGTALAAWLLRALGLRRPPAAPARRLGLPGAVALGMCVTSLNGVAWLRVAGAPEAAHFGQAWLSWLVGDSVGALLAGVPLDRLEPRRRRQGLRRRGPGNAALQADRAGLRPRVFSTALDKDSALVFPLLALPFFLLALLAMRGGVVASSTGVLVLAMAAAWGTARGLGRSRVHDARAGSLALWSYITAQACTSLLICGMGMALQASQRQFAAFLQNTPDGILVIDEQGTLLHANAGVRDDAGTGRHRAGGTPRRRGAARRGGRDRGADRRRRRADHHRADAAGRRRRGPARRMPRSRATSRRAGTGRPTSACATSRRPGGRRPCSRPARRASRPSATTCRRCSPTSIARRPTASPTRISCR